jgi:hypothetical protein
LAPKKQKTKNKFDDWFLGTVSGSFEDEWRDRNREKTEKLTRNGDILFNGPLAVSQA